MRGCAWKTKITHKILSNEKWMSAHDCRDRGAMAQNGCRESSPLRWEPLFLAQHWKCHTLKSCRLVAKRYAGGSKREKRVGI